MQRSPCAEHIDTHLQPRNSRPSQEESVPTLTLVLSRFCYRIRVGLIPSALHNDVTFVLITISVGGLEVFHRPTETWHPVQPVNGAFVVNIGDMLGISYWTRAYIERVLTDV